MDLVFECFCSSIQVIASEGIYCSEVPSAINNSWIYFHASSSIEITEKFFFTSPSGSLGKVSFHAWNSLVLWDGLSSLPSAI